MDRMARDVGMAFEAEQPHLRALPEEPFDAG